MEPVGSEQPVPLALRAVPPVLVLALVSKAQALVSRALLGPMVRV